jgi:hypothetical protein
MRQCFLFLAVFTMLFAAGSPAAQGAFEKASHSYQAGNVEWLFDSRDDRDGNPNTRVFLVVGGRRFFILRDVAQFSVLERKNYSARDVPSTAIAACTAWWAGSGEELYVIRRGRQLIVYIRYLDEQTELGRYRRLKTISLRG